MITWRQKRLGSIGVLLREFTRLMVLAGLLIAWGMAAVVSAEPLLPVEEPFADTTRPADATMLIEVQEYAKPLQETPLLPEPFQEPSPAPQEPVLSSQPEPSAVPEPSSWLLVGLGAFTLLWLRRSRQ